jgi:hypothetical protein
MAMQSKVFDHINYYFEERNDGTAGKIRRLHDWCNVSWGTISGWMPRPQRFISEGGISSDNMVDTTWDNMNEWPAQAMLDDRNPPMAIHELCEMPVAYSRTKRG